GQGLRRADQDGVGVDAKQMRFGEHVGKGPQEGLEMRWLKFIDLNPLAEYAVGLQLRAADLEKLSRKQIRCAGNPRVRRLRDDDIVLAVGDQQMVAGIITVL